MNAVLKNYKNTKSTHAPSTPAHLGTRTKNNIPNFQLKPQTHMIIKKLNIATTLTLLSFFNNCNATNCIYIEDSFLGLETYHNLQKKIPKNDYICFKNIPGGLASMLVKYSRLIEGKKVHVYGYCNSLCADLALSADRLFLHKSNDPKNPSHMVIHGTFNIQNETWDPSSLDSIEYYFDRFKIIEKKHIIQALSFKKYGPNGLVISSEPFPQLHPSKSLVHLCENFPNKCTSLNIFNLEKIGIHIKN